MEVSDYIIRRLMQLGPTVFIITTVTFLLTRIAGSPIGYYTSALTSAEQVERIKEIYHLNDPIWVQYFYWLRGVVQYGDLGFSTVSAAPVTDTLIAKAPASFELAVVGLLIAMVIAVTLGTLSGKYQDTWIDHFSRALAVGGMSTPQFWAALLLIFVFYVKFGIFPLGRADITIWGSIPHPTGIYTVDAILAGSGRALFDALWHLVLPALTIGYAESAVITRHLRSELVEKKREEYVKAARARGVVESTVFRRHIRRNALIPTLTVAGLSFVFLLRGIVVVELVFGWPGLGRWIAEAALTGDYPAIMGVILLVAVLTMGINLVVDVLYAYLDPRVELGE